jgi:hypothetical protein
MLLRLRETFLMGGNQCPKLGFVGRGFLQGLRQRKGASRKFLRALEVRWTCRECREGW